MSRVPRQWLVRAAALAAALACAACSSFPREWREATAAPGGAAAGSRPQVRPARDPFAGAWEGRWTSAKYHVFAGRPAGGRLRCVFTRLDDKHYRAHFKANWLAFASSYATTFTTERRGKELRFRGEQDLGAMFGGVYRYAGRVTPSHFTSSYDSSYDRGTFKLARK